ncbi:YwdI family protein [Bacillus altitudinis]|uniref:YwdI family protein n=1 Tax=Bacillus altitudinis TaxID=293387 RepID=UPI0024A7B4FA|nr:YwdI family protein [Bacillus altitudinis]WHF26822.1 YwdI family protein [Bacillus altitudinis]
MNIHISSLLQKMEEAIQKAKQSGNDEEVKRQAAVISSLCDVILDTSSQVQMPQSSVISPPPSIQTPSAQTPSAPAVSTDQAMLEKLMGTSGAKKFQHKEEGQQEKDGNGDSIFDF